MESTDFYTLSSSPSFSPLMESEEDFPFGAKTTSFLPPATVTNTATTAVYDLPEWMEEGQEVLGLPYAIEDLLSQNNELKEEDDCWSTIKPEDMLVPLSELQPPHTPASPPLATTPPVSPVHVPFSPPSVPVSPTQAPAIPAPADAPLPKIILCRKVTTSSLKNKPAQMHYQIMPVKQMPQVTPAAPQLLHTAPQISSMTSEKSHEGQVAVMHLGGSYEEPEINDMALAVPQSAPDTQVPQTCDAEQLINEMVQMIGSSSTIGGFQGIEGGAFDSSMMEASMYDLLSQLEASEPDNTVIDSTFLSPPSPAPTLTSLPSESPVSISVPSISVSESPSPSPTPFITPLPSESPSLSAPSPHPSEFPLPPSPISLPSPVPSVGSLSPAPSSSGFLSPSGDASPEREILEEEWSPLEEAHSYSRSQRKARSSRRTPDARKTPYPENRKERKKEQNKQAALRYRQKKKQEEDDMMALVRKEEERQQKLKSTYSGLKQELSYLKKIMREMFIARGTLTEEALKKAAEEKKRSK